MLIEADETSPVSANPADTAPVEGAAPAGDVAEGSSPSTPDVKEAPKTLLDVVKNAVADPKEPEGPSAEEAAKTPGEAPEGEAPADADEDFSKEPFGRHPRFKKLLEDRNRLRDENKGYGEKIAALEGPAQQYAHIEQFMQSNGLAPAEVIELFKVGALIKTDPFAAEEILLGKLMELQTVTGRILPQDLREDVEQGRITEDRARELSAARAKATFTGQRIEAVTAETTKREERRTADGLSARIQAAGDEWEVGKKAKDPSYAAKAESIKDRALVLIATKGAPRTPEEAVAILEQAHKDVTERMRAALPAKPAIQRSPSASSPVEATPAPKTLREAIEASVS